MLIFWDDIKILNINEQSIKITELLKVLLVTEYQNKWSKMK